MAYDLVRLNVTAVSPVLMHNPAAMSVGGGDTVERSGKKIPKPEVEARAGLYVAPGGQLYIGADCFREAGLIAAQEIRDKSRKGRATMTKRFGASVFLSREHCLLFKQGKPITDAEGDWEVFIKRVVIQRQGILRGRGLIRDWECQLEFEYDTDTIDPREIAAVMTLAGKYPGILDYRVGKKGPFGRFTVELAA